MKNQKLLFSFPACTSKENFLVHKGPESTPPAPEKGKEKPKDRPEAMEAFKTAQQFSAFLRGRADDLVRIADKSKSDIDRRLNHNLVGSIEAEGYTILLHGDEEYISTIEAMKGAGKLVIGFDGQLCGLSFNDRGIASSNDPNGRYPESISGDQKMLKEKIEQFHGILKRALEKANKEVKDF